MSYACSSDLTDASSVAAAPRRLHDTKDRSNRVPAIRPRNSSRYLRQVTASTTRTTSPLDRAPVPTCDCSVADPRRATRPIPDLQPGRCHDGQGPPIDKSGSTTTGEPTPRHLAGRHRTIRPTCSFSQELRRPQLAGEDPDCTSQASASTVTPPPVRDRPADPGRRIQRDIDTQGEGWNASPSTTMA